MEKVSEGNSFFFFPSVSIFFKQQVLISYLFYTY